MADLSLQPLDVLEHLVSNIELHIQHAYGQRAIELVRSSPVRALCVFAHAVYDEEDIVGAEVEVRCSPKPIIWDGAALSCRPDEGSFRDAPIEMPLAVATPRGSCASAARLTTTDLREILCAVHRHWFALSDHGGAQSILVVTDSAIFVDIDVDTIPRLIQAGASAEVISQSIYPFIDPPPPTLQQVCSILDADGDVGLQVLKGRFFRQTVELEEMIAAHQTRANSVDRARLKERMR